ncbi:hypothetical protein BDR26DRAFT_872710 [Obelidium mucronatum]|nr:hypothetical protein BDR26DRAFT_872710 [Obelidium mucronatum]
MISIAGYYDTSSSPETTVAGYSFGGPPYVPSTENQRSQTETKEYSCQYLESNVVEMIPPGYSLGGFNIVPSSPFTAVPVIHKTTNPYKLPSYDVNMHHFDQFSWRRASFAPSQSPSIMNESTTNTPVLGHLGSPQLHTYSDDDDFPPFIQLPPLQSITPPPAAPYHPNASPFERKTYPSTAVSTASATACTKASNHSSNTQQGAPKKRKRLSKENHQFLMKIFEENQHPDTPTLKQAAERVGMGLKHVQFFFQNRRAAVKRRTSRSD